ncbi:HTH-type transcriptional regulator TreR [Lactococcus lactis]|nr:HTH-type transcriptional regulator TreR [Lactococcus lactis]
MGFHSETEVIRFESIKITPALSETTGFAVGEHAISILRRRKVDGKFSILDWDLFLEKYSEGLTPEHAQNSTYDYLEGLWGLILPMLKRKSRLILPAKMTLNILT